MKSYWTNFVQNRTPNGIDELIAALLGGQEIPFWPSFDADGEVQLLVPGPAEPHPFDGFSAEHNCQPLEARGLLGG
jgi:hypothetical protein